MPTVFIVHAQEDCDEAVRLQESLTRRGCAASLTPRDLEKDSQWPAVLGRQFSDAGSIVLLWSRISSESPTVALAWTTALALKKRIVTCVLDATALLPALQLHPSYRMDPFDEAVEGILQVANDDTAGRSVKSVDPKVTDRAANSGAPSGEYAIASV